MSDISVTVTNPGSAAVTIGAGDTVSATVSTGGSVAVNLPGGEAAWTNITGKPTTFTPATHTHLAADITDRATALVTSVNGQTGAVTVSGGGGGGASLSDDPAQPLSLFPSAGVSTDAARADHVHQFPSPSQIGALDASSVVDGGDYVGVVMAPETPTINITLQPANQTSSSGAATFTVAASVSDGSTPAFQWQKSDDAGASWGSVAGVAWTQQTLPASRYWGAIGYGNGTFVAFPRGSSGNLSPTSTAHTSTDGVAWAARTVPSLVYVDVAYGNGLFVATAANTANPPSRFAVVSADGVTWTQQTLPSNMLTRVTYGNGVFVAYGGDGTTGAIATSADGVAWTQRTAPVGNWADMAYGGGLFVAVASGNSNYCATSPDGITWTQRTMPANANWYSVAFGNGTFVSVTTVSNIAATSTDGVTWTQRTLPSSGHWYGIAFGDGMFVAIESSGASAYSVDGISWIPATLPAASGGTAGWLKIAYGNGTFLATSDGSTSATAVAGATSSTLALTGLTIDNDQDQYRAVVSATNAASVTSNAATLTVPDGTAWVQRGGDIDGLSSGDFSGWSVAVSNDGTVMATGARYNNAGGSQAGCARVYSWDGTSWTQRGADFAVGAAGDQSGYSVAMNGDGTLVAVGAPVASGSNGLVRVYSWNGTAWTQRGSNLTPSAHAGQAGWSVALDDDGEWLIVGLPYDSEFGSNNGKADVYRWTGTAWDSTIPGGGVGGYSDDYVGYAVAVSGDGSRWAWGGPGHDYGYEGTGSAGVRIWNGSYFEIDYLHVGDGASFMGYSVALNLDGTVFAVGGAGVVRVYAKSGNSWSQRGSISTTGGAIRSLSLSDSGAVLAVGNPDDDGGGSNAGNVSVYAWNGSAWVQRGGDIDGESANDYSGRSVALSADGTILVVGAYGNDGGGTNSGHVRVFKWQ